MQGRSKQCTGKVSTRSNRAAVQRQQKNSSSYLALRTRPCAMPWEGQQPTAHLPGEHRMENAVQQLRCRQCMQCTHLHQARTPSICELLVRLYLCSRYFFVLCDCRKLEEVLVLKQSRMLALIREGNRQQAAAAAAAASAGTEAGVDHTKPSRGLKRSRSVAWSSATLHASSDGFTEAAEVAAAAAEAAAAARKLQTSSASSSSADNR